METYLEVRERCVYEIVDDCELVVVVGEMLVVLLVEDSEVLGIPE